MKPALLVDVDGVLNVQSKGAEIDWRAHDVLSPLGHRSMRLVLNPVHGEWLRALADQFELVWCTTWGSVANERISPLVGLPTDMDVVKLPGAFSGRDEEMSPKTPWVRRWAEGRDLAWIDDDVDERDQAVLTDEELTDSTYPLANTVPVKNALTLTIDAGEGLTWAHVEQLLAWAADLKARQDP